MYSLWVIRIFQTKELLWELYNQAGLSHLLINTQSHFSANFTWSRHSPDVMQIIAAVICILRTWNKLADIFLFLLLLLFRG